MTVKTVTIPWGDGTTDKIYLTWNDASLPGVIPVDIASDPNYTGKQREYLSTFIGRGPVGGQNVTKTCTIIQTTDNLVIAVYDSNKTVAMHSNVKAGYPKK